MSSKDLVAHRFQPGMSGNPGGRPKALLTKSQVENIVQGMSQTSPNKLKAIIADPDESAIRISIAQAWLKVIKSGDMVAIDNILNRGVGKVANVIESEDERARRERREHLETLSDEQLLEMVKESIPQLEAAKDEPTKD